MSVWEADVWEADIWEGESWDEEYTGDDTGSTMGTSGSRDYIETRDSLIIDALGAIGAIAQGDGASPEQLAEGGRYLNRIVSHWQTRNVFLWTQTDRIKLLTGGIASYALGASIVAVENVFWRANGIDTPLRPLTRAEYKALSNKAAEGPPSRFYVDYQLAQPVLYLWPVCSYSTGLVTGSDGNSYLCAVDHVSVLADNKPVTGTNYSSVWGISSETGAVAWVDGASYYSGHVRYTEVARLQDFDAAIHSPDAPSTGYLALLAELTYRLSFPYGIPLKERLLLKQEAKELFGEFANGGKESADLQIVPYFMG